MGCRQPGERSVLLRFAVAEVDGQQTVVHDPARTLPGRGAWLHPDEDCWQLALRRSAFGRALRSPARLDQVGISEVIAALSPEHD
ncbi:YlxR family protein [Angustibacter luteus]|uniref:YlxR family protein n=1 Tax=Angustibacter luteus TaxID=658456 RepID=A0ABW1JK50_9ACTN